MGTNTMGNNRMQVFRKAAPRQLSSESTWDQFTSAGESRHYGRHLVRGGR